MSILHTTNPCAVRRSLLMCALLSALLLTTGCGHLGNYFHNGFKVGPDYCRPAADVADALRALGRSDLEAQSAIRFSIGRPTRSADIDVAIERYRNAVSKLRRIAPGRAA